MGNSYSIYRFSYHVFSDSTVLPINHQKNIIQHYWYLSTHVLIADRQFLLLINMAIQNRAQQPQIYKIVS